MKIAKPTKPITAVIVSNIANALYATARQKTAATLHSQKDFQAPTNNPDRSRSLRNRRASSCDPAPRIWDFAPRRMKRCSELIPAAQLRLGVVRVIFVWAED
jgi:hypothetical protein